MHGTFERLAAVARVLVSLVTLLAVLLALAGCADERPSAGVQPSAGAVGHGKEQVTNVSSDETLSGHIGDRVRVTGRAGRSRFRTFVASDIERFELLEWEWSERTVGAEVVVTGVLGRIEEHVAPKQDQDYHFATDEPPGALIPARYTLTDVRLVETHER